MLFLSNSQIRWSRSRSRERKSKKKLGEDCCGARDSHSTDYAADNSSDHSSSATQSPQHRLLGSQHTTGKLIFQRDRLFHMKN